MTEKKWLVVRILVAATVIAALAFVTHRMWTGPTPEQAIKRAVQPAGQPLELKGNKEALSKIEGRLWCEEKGAKFGREASMWNRIRKDDKEPLSKQDEAEIMADFMENLKIFDPKLLPAWPLAKKIISATDTYDVASAKGIALCIEYFGLN
jgi:hypothetical protein